MLLLVLGLTLPPLLIVGWLALTGLSRARETAEAEGRTALRTQAQEVFLDRVGDKSQRYDTALASVQRAVETVARFTPAALAPPATPPPLDTTRIWVAPDGPASAGLANQATTVAQVQQLAPLLQAAVDQQPLVNIGYVALEESGILVVSDAAVIERLSSMAPFDPRERPWYSQARESGATIWTGVYRDINTGQLTTTCATPIYDVDGAFRGVVGFDVLLSQLESRLLASNIASGGYAFLINSRGEIVARPDLPAERTAWAALFTSGNLRAAAGSEMQAVVDQMVARKAGIQFLDIAGQATYVAYAPITTADWSVGLLVAADDIEQPALEIGARIAERQEDLQRQLMVLIGAILLLCVIVGVLTALSLTGPIGALKEGALLIAGGKLDHQLPVQSNDEIGQLVRSFNAMTAALRDKIGELEANASHLAALNQVSNQLKAILDLPRLLDAIPRVVCEQFGFDQAILYLVDDQVLRVPSAVLGPGREEEARRFVATINAEPIRLDGQSIEADIVRSGQAVIVTDAHDDPRAQELHHIVMDRRSYVQVPIFGRERRVIGIIAADYFLTARPVTAHDASELLTFANMVGLTIENVRLYDDLERKVAQRTTELRLALERARTADQRKSHFLASVSHELRTPLNAIIGFSTVLLDEIDGPLAELQREDVQCINRNGRFLLYLINELLDLARIEAGRLELDREPHELAAIVFDVVDLTQGLLRNRAIELQIQMPADLPLVDVDANRVRQILLNLLSNAVKFTERGRIVVSARVARRSDVAGRMRARGKSGLSRAWVVVVVQDSGVGIPLDAQGQLFEEFSQLHGPHSRMRGTGLGLAITRRLVEAHGGGVWATSQPGQGSRFAFVLPIVTYTAVGADQQRNQRQVGAGR